MILPFTPQIPHQQQTAFENIVGKGKIACNKQFFLFPQCFLLKQIIVSPFGHIFVIMALFKSLKLAYQVMGYSKVDVFVMTYLSNNLYLYK